MSAGYAYGIDALSRGTKTANFVLNQGSDDNINVRALSININSGTTLTLQGTQVVVPAGTPLAVSSLAANSIYLRGVSVAAAAPASIDLSNPVLQAAFPSGAYCYFECGDGAGSSVTGFTLVGTSSVLGAPVKNNGALAAPVTDVAVTVATSVLSFSFTGKVATTNGYIRLTRVVT
jgi:hypothetical protein